MTALSEARLVRIARETARQLPEVREDKVNALKQAISSVAYAPTDDEVAVSIIRGLV